MRFDFDGLDTTVADKLMADLEAALPALNGKTFNDYTVSDAAPFIYNDPVDGSSTKKRFGNQILTAHALSTACPARAQAVRRSVYIWKNTRWKNFAKTRSRR